MLPFIVFATIWFAYCFGFIIPYYIKEVLYSVSVSIKDILIFILPIIIFSLIFQSVSKLKSKKVLKLATLLMLMIVCSNIISTSIAYFIGSKALFSALSSVSFVRDDNATLNLLWTLHLPVIIKNSTAVITGFIAGIIFSNFRLNLIKKNINKLSKASIFFLQNIFKPIIPIFILGFILKMQTDNTLSSFSFNEYLRFLSSVFIITYSYIILLYGIGNAFIIKRWILSIFNMLPAALVALSSMSSIAAMPATLLANEKNSNKNISQLVVPISVNIHLIGDCFFIIILSFALAYSFYGGVINIHDTVGFMIYFILSKFAIAAVPGGGIIVILPILEQYLYFSSTMLSMITALYIICDPLITVANVMGNGAFTIIFSKTADKTGII